MVKASNHPAGITALLAGAIVIVAGKCGLDLSTEEAATFAALAVAIVSYFSPRKR